MLPHPDCALAINASLFLDFDGTLVELAATPSAVAVDADLHNLMSRLNFAFDGRLGIISGRPVAQLRSLLGNIPITMIGSHGAEIVYADGSMIGAVPPDNLDEIVRELCSLQNFYPAILIEQKPYGVALHYRGAPEAEAVCRNWVMAISRSTGLVVLAGKMVFELRAPGADKGTALRKLFDVPSLTGTRPIFIGDDETDEAAFAVADELGGAGILVGLDRPTAAHFQLESVAKTIEWLELISGQIS